mmetsp:Transcript_42072/g.105061  ORF Transcript_42072/g.105061 Transcript_42072/m.105061 type:complete len:233 (+) Transcript_42072:2128-2826(+)
MARVHAGLGASEHDTDVFGGLVVDSDVSLPAPRGEHQAVGAEVDAVELVVLLPQLMQLLVGAFGGVPVDDAALHIDRNQHVPDSSSRSVRPPADVGDGCAGPSRDGNATVKPHETAAGKSCPCLARCGGGEEGSQLPSGRRVHLDMAIPQGRCHQRIIGRKADREDLSGGVVENEPRRYPFANPTDNGTSLRGCLFLPGLLLTSPPPLDAVRDGLVGHIALHGHSGFVCRCV